MQTTGYYWRCQWLGWGVVVLSNVLVQLPSATFVWWQQLLSNGLFLLLGIGCSHGLRAFYRHYKIEQRALTAMILPWLLGAALATAIVIVVIFIGLSVVLPDADAHQLWQLRNIASNIVGIYPLFLIWGSLYLGVHYLWHWRESAQQNARLEAALHQAQVNTLIGQLNPHFMFNALNNIRALMLEDVEKSRQAIGLMAKVLRASLCSPQQRVVALASELAVVEDFIALATLQYEQRLQWQLVLDPACAAIAIPPMTLQMLVENAIKHGIAQTPGGGVLQVRIAQVDARVQISVTNPGSLQPSQLAETSTGLGLANIRARLHLLYGDAAQFTLCEEAGLVTATLIIPRAMRQEL